MKKLVKRIGICLILAASVWCGTLIADRQRLNEELIRLHVVANSDSDEDQAIKLQVRDAVTASLQNDLAKIADVEEAKAYLQANLPKIQAVANKTLEAAGCDCEAVVTLCREAFDTRYYDTFTLPAGVYEALRITIGGGEGHNWWCVAFPTLCLPATSEGFASEAAGAGFPDSLTGALTGEEAYEVRFFLLDALGELENILFAG
ncbi:MAG: stage II sporulation protein R [Faecousia sp.]